MNTINIWEPHYLSKSVYVAPHKIQPGMNRIVFTKTKAYPPLLMDSRTMREYPMTSNGKIGVYKIPLADFANESLIKQERLEV